MMTSLRIRNQHRRSRRAAACVAVILGALGPLGPHGTQAQTITKCQDAEGNWHYGDYAAEACARESEITEIDERGLKVKETEPPPTREELDARKDRERQQQLEQQQEARQEAENERLLATYDSATAIIRARDQRLEALEQELRSHRLFRQDLVDEKRALGEDAPRERVENLEQQIEQFDQAISELEQERRRVRDEYNEDLARYRELTGEQ